VPRFAALRTEVPVAAAEGLQALVHASLVKKQDLLTERVPSIQASQTKQLKGYTGRARPSVNVNALVPEQLIGLKVLQAQHLNIGLLEAVNTKRIALLSPVQKVLLLKQMKLAHDFSVVKHLAGTEQVYVTSVVARVEQGPEIISASVTTRDLTVCCNEAPCPPDKPLCLFKCADCTSAKIGDVITFTLKYSNVGGRPMTDVAVTDSLSGRLEYVEDSAESDRDAVFTTQRNEAGSVMLRWEITGRLLPGQSGKLRFKAKVR
jgi:uncharacterized repeat protein (TIGR01451 family)